MSYVIILYYCPRNETRFQCKTLKPISASTLVILYIYLRDQNVYPSLSLRAAATQPLLIKIFLATVPISLEPKTAPHLIVSVAVLLFTIWILGEAVLS